MVTTPIRLLYTHIAIPFINIKHVCVNRGMTSNTSLNIDTQAEKPQQFLNEVAHDLENATLVDGFKAEVKKVIEVEHDHMEDKDVIFVVAEVTGTVFSHHSDDVLHIEPVSEDTVKVTYTRDMCEVEVE